MKTFKKITQNEHTKAFNSSQEKTPQKKSKKLIVLGMGLSAATAAISAWRARFPQEEWYELKEENRNNQNEFEEFAFKAKQVAHNSIINNKDYQDKDFMIK